MYTPANIPQSNDLQELKKYLADELAQISNVMQNDFMVFPYREAAPLRVIEGMVTAANGTTWNPGAGKGLYIYLSGAWVKL
jgi:hypothetical protein